MKKRLMSISALALLTLAATGCTSRPDHVENNLSRLHADRGHTTIVKEVRVDERDGDYIKGNDYVYGAKTERDITSRARRQKRHNRHKHQNGITRTVKQQGIGITDYTVQ